MDWIAAIETNREALKRILAALVAMAGGLVLRGNVAPSLPRHLHRAVLRLLRPAEAATRRLVIAAARDIVVTLPPPRKATPPYPRQRHAALRSLGLAVVLSQAEIAAEAARKAAQRLASGTARLGFPLLDPLGDPFRWRRRPVQRDVPRISGFDSPRTSIVLKPSPYDPIVAARLALRLQALGRVLDDLPTQAQRFARWRAHRDASRTAEAAQKEAPRPRRLWPLKPGLPPGATKRDWLGPDSTRRPSHEVHEVLHNLHGLAFWALERRDTS